MYKIVPAKRQERSRKIITKNRCKPSKKRLTAVIFGTPGWVRTSGLSLRSLAFQFCVLLYFLYNFFSFHIMLYGGYT